MKKSKLNKNYFVPILFFLFLLVSSFAQNQNELTDDKKSKILIIKLPYHVINYNFKYKRQFFYDIESEIKIRNNLSLVNSIGVLPRTNKGFILIDSYDNNINEIHNGYALQASISIRRYLFNKPEGLSKNDLNGFYFSLGLGYVFANYLKKDDTKFNMHFPNIYIQCGWQKSFRNFNLDISPFKLYVLYTFYNKHFDGLVGYLFDPTISFGLKIISKNKKI
ncbi:MAG: hypothetical protein V1904_00575 [Bacteroidota bacterium]